MLASDGTYVVVSPDRTMFAYKDLTTDQLQIFRSDGKQLKSLAWAENWRWIERWLDNQSLLKDKSCVNDVVNGATLFSEGVSRLPVGRARLGVRLNVLEIDLQILGASAQHVPQGGCLGHWEAAKHRIREDDIGVVASAHAGGVMRLEGGIELLNQFLVWMHEC
jgi:hypothetical protein